MMRIVLGVFAVLLAAYAIQVHRELHEPPSVAGQPRIVPVASTDQVLDLIRRGKKVLFVDAREPREWEDEHIPGAIDMTLRDVAHLDRKALGNPDLIVAYCLKDFRGFEVAKALQHAGVAQASNLMEMGINGWKQRGLPTVIAGKRSESEARLMLAACVHGEAAHCGAAR